MENLKDLTTKLKPLLEKYDLFFADLVVFGSFVKEKAFPEDVDIAAITKPAILPDDVERGTKEILDSIQGEFGKRISKIHLQVVNAADMSKEPIFLTLIKEGYSVREEKFLRDLYDITPEVLYKYSLKDFTSVQKVQFDRGLKTVLAECEGEKLGRTVALVPLDASSAFEEFLKTWKLEFEKRRFELLGERRAASVV